MGRKAPSAHAWAVIHTLRVQRRSARVVELVVERVPASVRTGGTVFDMLEAAGRFYGDGSPPQPRANFAIRRLDRVTDPIGIEHAKRVEWAELEDRAESGSKRLTVSLPLSEAGAVRRAAMSAGVPLARWVHAALTLPLLDETLEARVGERAAALQAANDLTGHKIALDPRRSE